MIELNCVAKNKKKPDDLHFVCSFLISFDSLNLFRNSSSPAPPDNIVFFLGL